MYIFIGTRLASHGYIVAAIEPWADCQWPWSNCDDLLAVMVDRPRDISSGITQLPLKNTTIGELLLRSIDPEKIAASGHSIGGYTKYALAAADNLLCDAQWPPIIGDDPLSQRPLLRQAPQVRAVCGRAARTDPCGGQIERPVPTTTKITPRQTRCDRESRTSFVDDHAERNSGEREREG